MPEALRMNWAKWFVRLCVRCWNNKKDSLNVYNIMSFVCVFALIYVLFCTGWSERSSNLYRYYLNRSATRRLFVLRVNRNNNMFIIGLREIRLNLSRCSNIWNVIRYMQSQWCKLQTRSRSIIKLICPHVEKAQSENTNSFRISWVFSMRYTRCEYCYTSNRANAVCSAPSNKIHFGQIKHYKNYKSFRTSKHNIKWQTNFS